MFKRLPHNYPSSVHHKLVSELFRSAQLAGRSQQKATQALQLPAYCHELSHAIFNGSYSPEPYQHFAITEPKLREIYAPSFKDRIVQMWVCSHLTPLMENRFIDDTYANRKGKGTYAAIEKSQKLMRQPKHQWALSLDIYSYFNQIDKTLLLNKIERLVANATIHPLKQRCLIEVTKQIITHDTAREALTRTGDQSLLHAIPKHKRLIHSPKGTGLPIGSVTSQLMGNYYLNDLDHFIKHELKVKGYVRYMDDLFLLADSPDTLRYWQQEIKHYLKEHLKLKLHPTKVHLDKVKHGFDYLGYRIYGHHKFIRQSTVQSLKQRLRYFRSLLAPNDTCLNELPPERGQWQRWYRAGNTPPLGLPLYRAMLSTINSYYGLLSHANHCRLRKSLYHHHFGELKTLFIPANAHYTSVKLRSCHF
ncbi:RNA-directed DNA polymerase [Vibrio chagasii]|uniref:RNA-directed DNA polymerase n=1 Tax=Vibrio chagasii TaxID=170679 RepID=UPI0020A3B151|nr:RNA-directed DNA polymerase [Vibrio chagasii]